LLLSVSLSLSVFIILLPASPPPRLSPGVSHTHGPTLAPTRSSPAPAPSDTSGRDSQPLTPSALHDPGAHARDESRLPRPPSDPDPDAAVGTGHNLHHPAGINNPNKVTDAGGATSAGKPPTPAAVGAVLWVPDPVDPGHNLAACVSYRHEYAIRRALGGGAARLARSLRAWFRESAETPSALGADGGGPRKEVSLEKHSVLAGLFEAHALLKANELRLRARKLQALRAAEVLAQVPPTPHSPPAPGEILSASARDATAHGVSALRGGDEAKGGEAKATAASRDHVALPAAADLVTPNAAAPKDIEKAKGKEKREQDKERSARLDDAGEGVTEITFPIPLVIRANPNNPYQAPGDKADLLDGTSSAPPWIASLSSPLLGNLDKLMAQLAHARQFQTPVRRVHTHYTGPA
jgi:hypothetical protein